MNALGLREAFAAAGYEVPGNPRSLPKDFEDSGTHLDNNKMTLAWDGLHLCE